MGVGIFPHRNVQVVQTVQQIVSKAQEGAGAYSGGKHQLLSWGNHYAFPWNKGNEQQERLKLFSTSSWKYPMITMHIGLITMLQGEVLVEFSSN